MWKGNGTTVAYKSMLHLEKNIQSFQLKQNNVTKNALQN